MGILEIVKRFAIHGELLEAGAFGDGIINETFVSVWDQAGIRLRYLHQKINHGVFCRPDEVMENIVRVSRHIREKAAAEGLGSASRRSLTVVPARDGRPLVIDEDGFFWRTYGSTDQIPMPGFGQCYLPVSTERSGVGTKGNR